MTRDDVIRMAREAGLETHERKGHVRIGSSIITGCDNTEQVERFAQLVAAHERKSAAEFLLFNTWTPPESCNSLERSLWRIAVEKCAEDIQARGQS